MARLKVFAIVVCLGVLIAASLNALSVVNVSDEQLARKAEMIVIGTVLSGYCEKDTGSGDVYTYITVRVTDQLKGKMRSHDLVLKILGGRAGDAVLYIPGAADFYRNEEVLLFLERRPDGSLMPIGMMLGKYSVYRDYETGRKIVFRHIDGNGQYFSTPRPNEVIVEPGQKLYLSDFRSQIQKFVGVGR